MVVQHLHGGIAKPALRHVDDALEGEIVGRRIDGAQISQRVADFGALVEPGAADHAIGQAERDEAVFELAHLERGAHQDRDLVQVFAGALQLLDLLADGAGFLFGVPGAGDGDLFAVLVLGAQGLAEAAFIVRDQMRGGGEDVPGGAIVALQPNDFGAGKIVVEAQDVVDLGAAPAIDRLVVIADAADVFGGRGRLPASFRDALKAQTRNLDVSFYRSPRFRVRVFDAPRNDRGTSACGTLATAPATAIAATDIARRWCPDIRRPG